MRKLLLLVLLLVAPLAVAQGIPIKAGSSSNVANVDANGNLRVGFGQSTRATYIASSSGNSCNATNILAIEATAGTGLKLVSWCANTTEATAGTGITVQVRRTTAASSGGTAATAEGTGANTVSKFDPADGNYSGVVRGAAPTITAGATLDQVGFTTGEVGTGAETVPAYSFCRTYGLSGEKLPTVTSGTANGIAVQVSASGAGGLSFCAISAVFISE